MVGKATCEVPDCDRESVATSTDPMQGTKHRVCEVHGLLFEKLDAKAREGYAVWGDPRANRSSLVEWDPFTPDELAHLDEL